MAREQPAIDAVHDDFTLRDPLEQESLEHYASALSAARVRDGRRRLAPPNEV